MYTRASRISASNVLRLTSIAPTTPHPLVFTLPSEGNAQLSSVDWWTLGIFTWEERTPPAHQYIQNMMDCFLVSQFFDATLGIGLNSERRIRRKKVRIFNNRHDFAAKWDLKEVDVELLLGLTVEKLGDGSVSLNQTQYFLKVLDHFGFSDLPPLSTPLPPGYQIHAASSPLSPEDADFMRDKPFCPILGTIVWGSSGIVPVYKQA
ncbi:hypothetical protein B0H13DRAFT_2352179 [Mycena leptocephala]|nr:hypothetical protein B0H13DRAFT_2352179 [Mycena leptocephala]